MPEHATPYETPPGQLNQSLDPKDYSVRIVVFGSRGYQDKREFHRVMCEFLRRFDGQDVLFISGAARHGADRMIIDWCRKFGYPCLEMPADWDNPEFRLPSGKSRAGFMRNEAMAIVCTHGVGFWDGTSPGTADMIERVTEHKATVKIIQYTAS